MASVFEKHPRNYTAQLFVICDFLFSYLLFYKR